MNFESEPLILLSINNKVNVIMYTVGGRILSGA